jgi:hypothetical protein
LVALNKDDCNNIKLHAYTLIAEISLPEIQRSSTRHQQVHGKQFRFVSCQQRQSAEQIKDCKTWLMNGKYNCMTSQRQPAYKIFLQITAGSFTKIN